jgi:hypothetical protein
MRHFKVQMRGSRPAFKPACFHKAKMAALACSRAAIFTSSGIIFELKCASA